MTGTVIEINLTVHSSSPGQTVALVLVDQVDAAAAVLTGVTVTLLELQTADRSGVTRLTLTGEGGDAVSTHSMVTGLRVTVIHILHTERTREPFCTVTLVAVGTVDALGSVTAGRAGTLIDVHLTHVPTETWKALADEAIDLVQAFPVIQTGGAAALINVLLTVQPLEPWHTDTGVVSNLVQAGGLVSARVGSAFVEILLAARSGIAAYAVTRKRALCVHTLATVLTGVRADDALIDVVIAGAAIVAGRAVAVELAVDRVCVALRPLSAGVTDAGIIHMAEQARLPEGAGADEGGDSVDAGGAGGTGRGGAVVDVLGAVRAAPAVDADAVIAALHITTGAAILTCVGLQATLVHILCAELTCPLRRTLTVVSVDPVHTGPSVLTVVLRTVVDIHLTVGPVESRQAVAPVAGVRGLPACSAVDAG